MILAHDPCVNLKTSCGVVPCIKLTYFTININFSDNTLSLKKTIPLLLTCFTISWGGYYKVNWCSPSLIKALDPENSPSFAVSLIFQASTHGGVMFIWGRRLFSKSTKSESFSVTENSPSFKV